MSSRPLEAAAPSVSGWSMARRDASIAKSPATMKMTSGISFAAVSALTTMLLWRMPRTLIAVMATVISVITMARAGPLPKGGQ